MTPMFRIRVSSLPLLACVMVAGCGSGHDPQAADPEEPIAVASSSLMRLADNCADVDSAIRREVRAGLRRAYANGQTCSSYAHESGTGVVMDRAVGSTDMGATEGGPVAINGAGGWASSSQNATRPTKTEAPGDSGVSLGIDDGDGNGSLPTITTSTNTQVTEVDEADIVKTDGKNIYVLHDQVLELVQAWPVDALEGQASLALEGYPREMFVLGKAEDAQRQVVVISEVDGTAVYQRAGVKPSTGAGLSDSTDDVGAAEELPGEPLRMAVGGAAGWKTPEGTGASANSTEPDFGDAKLTASPSAAAAGVTTGYPAGNLPMTKVTVLDATDGSLEVKSQVYYDGRYQSSRRQDNRMHAVLGLWKQWPSLDACATDADRLKAEMVVLSQLMQQNREAASVSSEELERLVLDQLVDIVLERNQKSLDTIQATDFVPRRFVYDGDNLTAHELPCERMYLPKAGSSASGVTYIAEIDLTDPTAEPGSHAILGQSDIMYENGTALVLASNSSESRPYPEGWAEVAYLHRFGLGDQGLTYEASAALDGRIKDQFSLDVRDDTLRVVASEKRGTQQKNRLTILREARDSAELSTVGEVNGVGDGEDVRAVRYVGDTAYVVTFVQTDPLFTLDLTDAANPRIAGELPDIPGFSTYMHPIDDNHLLTIGLESGTSMLQVFDVTDKSKPAEQLHKLPLSPGGSSIAVDEYKAFTYYPEQKLLAIPFVSYQSRPHNAMLVFSVDIEQGIELLGAVDGDFITGIPTTQNPSCWYGGDSSTNFQRGVFFDQVLYAVAQHGIAAVNAEKPSEVLGRLVFAAAQERPSYHCDVYYSNEEPVLLGIGGAMSTTSVGSGLAGSANSGSEAADGAPLAQGGSAGI
ncbi:beta-propeller domain-containing protein [Myxococcota bacterium]